MHTQGITFWSYMTRILVISRPVFSNILVQMRFHPDRLTTFRPDSALDSILTGAIRTRHRRPFMALSPAFFYPLRSASLDITFTGV